MRKSNIIYFLSYIVIIIYFGVVIYNELPLNPIKKEELDLKKLPFFEEYLNQSWTLFAPRPGIGTYRILYSCDHSNWFDPADFHLRKSQRNRFSSEGKMVYLYVKLAESVVIEIENYRTKASCFSEKCTGFFYTFKTTSAYSTILKISKYYCKKSESNKVKLQSIYLPTLDEYKQGIAAKVTEDLLEFSL